MRHPFHLLELGADADERAVKRAYARLLRRFRPDEDPAGFQRLNEAYRQALAIVNARSDVYGLDEDGFDDDGLDENGLDGDSTVGDASIDDTTGTSDAVGIAGTRDRSIDDRIPGAAHDSDTVAHTTAAPQPSSSHIGTPRFDVAADVEALLAVLYEGDIRTLRAFLHAKSNLWSYQEKRMVGRMLMFALHDREPPVPWHNFELINTSFGYDDLIDGEDAMALRALMTHLDRIWHLAQHRRRDRRNAEGTDPPWGEEACLVWRALLDNDIDAGGTFRRDHRADTTIDTPPPLLRVAGMAFEVVWFLLVTLILALPLMFLIAPIERWLGIELLPSQSFFVTSTQVYVYTLGLRMIHRLNRWQSQPPSGTGWRARLHTWALPAMIGLSLPVLHLSPPGHTWAELIAGMLIGLGLVAAWWRHDGLAGPPLGRHVGYLGALAIIGALVWMNHGLHLLGNIDLMHLAMLMTLLLWLKQQWHHFRTRRIRST